MADRVLLIGMMGAGKTTIGRRLAGKLGWRYVDSDDEIVAATGRSVREIFETDGEAAFRREESAVLRAALEDPAPAVVAVAGGAVLDEANRQAIAAGGLVVWLRAPVEVLAERAASGDHRPLLDGDPHAALATLYATREPIYAELAEVVVDVDGREPDDIVAELVERVAT